VDTYASTQNFFYYRYSTDATLLADIKTNLAQTIAKVSFNFDSQKSSASPYPAKQSMYIVSATSSTGYISKYELSMTVTPGSPNTVTYDSLIKTYVLNLSKEGIL